MFAKPDENRAAALYAISVLGLLVSELAFFDLLYDGQFKAQCVIALSTLFGGRYSGIHK